MERLRLIFNGLYFLKGLSCIKSGSLTHEATFIREVILKTFKFSKELPCSLTINDFEKMSTEKLSEGSKRLLNLIFSGIEPNTKK